MVAGQVPKSTTLRRQKLGAFVRAHRDARDLSQQELAGLIAASQPKINRIERGEVSVKLTDLEAIIDRLRIPPADANQMRALASLTQQRKRRDSAPKHARTLFDTEADAVVVRGFHSERLPGPLQSEKYLCRQGGVETIDQLTDKLAGRLQRRKVLFESEDGPWFQYVLSESALRRTVRGDESVRLDQVSELLTIEISYPRVSLHVLPFDADTDHVPTDFTLLEFADRDRDFVYIELSASSVELRAKDQLDAYQEEWAKLLGAAYSRTESREFLRELHGNWAALRRSSD